MYGSRVHGLLGVNCVSESGVPLITVRDLLLAVCPMVFLKIELKRKKKAEWTW